jgi:hypothetical protein
VFSVKVLARLPIEAAWEAKTGRKLDPGRDSPLLAAAPRTRPAAESTASGSYRRTSFVGRPTPNNIPMGGMIGRSCPGSRSHEPVKCIVNLKSEQVEKWFYSDIWLRQSAISRPDNREDLCEFIEGRIPARSLFFPYAQRVV